MMVFYRKKIRKNNHVLTFILYAFTDNNTKQLSTCVTFRYSHHIQSGHKHLEKKLFDFLVIIVLLSTQQQSH